MGHKLLRLECKPSADPLDSLLPNSRSDSMATLHTVSLSDLSLQKSPQGSVLSPQLFTLHTDDCRRTDPDMFSLKYSDDTIILDAFRRLLGAAGAFASWRKSNHPDLKASKTKGMVIDLACNLTPLSNLTVDSQTIKQVDECKC